MPVRADAMELLRAINERAGGVAGQTVAPGVAVQDTSLELGSDRYEEALELLLVEGALEEYEPASAVVGGMICTLTQRGLDMLSG